MQRKVSVFGFMLVLVALLIVPVATNAAAGTEMQPAANASVLDAVEAHFKGAIKVDKTGRFLESIHVGSSKPGVGGVTYMNGTVVNKSKDENGNEVAFTVGDDVRIDGAFFRMEEGGTYPIKVADSIMPKDDNTYSLGMSQSRFKDGYFSGQINVNSMKPDGQLTVEGSIKARGGVNVGNAQTGSFGEQSGSLSLEAGTIQWNGQNFQGWNGHEWTQLDGASPWMTEGSDVYYLSGNVGIGKKAPTQRLDVAGTIQGQNIIPAVANTYSLGSESMPWKDVYVGPGSIYVDSNTLSSSADILNVDNALYVKKDDIDPTERGVSAGGSSFKKGVDFTMDTVGWMKPTTPEAVEESLGMHCNNDQENVEELEGVYFFWSDTVFETRMSTPCVCSYSEWTGWGWKTFSGGGCFPELLE
ncbi:hypothetical protein KKH43_02700 [Patescibacteria group bacterium]|nr:hypothetical protein [Patescibacteria group bacterium]